MATLRTSEGDITLSKEAAAQSKLIVGLVYADTALPERPDEAVVFKLLDELIASGQRPTISLQGTQLDHASTLKNVEFLEAPAVDRVNPEWVSAFFAPYRQPGRDALAATLKLLQVANYLHIDTLIEAIKKHIADYYIRDNTPATVLEKVGLPVDTVFSEEERQAVYRNFPWLAVQ